MRRWRTRGTVLTPDQRGEQRSWKNGLERSFSPQCVSRQKSPRENHSHPRLPSTARGPGDGKTFQATDASEPEQVQRLHRLDTYDGLPDLRQTPARDSSREPSYP